MSNIVPTTPTATPISGKRFAYNHLSRDERGKAGADIYDQRRPVEGLTMRQVSAVVGASAAEINRHRSTRRPKRRLLTLAKHIAKASPEEFADAVAVHGPDRIFDLFFAPTLSL
jgi:hypothetical protein